MTVCTLQLLGYKRTYQSPGKLTGTVAQIQARLESEVPTAESIGVDESNRRVLQRNPNPVHLDVRHEATRAGGLGSAMSPPHTLMLSL